MRCVCYDFVCKNAHLFSYPVIFLKSVLFVGLSVTKYMINFSLLNFH